ncbi:MAG: hypothetical protein UHS50_01695, partial [Bacteroidaceae bacterium]|nr:hypothetical protein [Bacteroidaceae bacterium]
AGTKLSPQRKNFYSTVLQQFNHYVSTLLQNSNRKHKGITKKAAATGELRPLQWCYNLTGISLPTWP